MINRELRERQRLLASVLLPAPEEGIPVSSAMTGRMVALLPGVKLMSGVPGSKVSNRLEDIQEKLEESIRVGVGPFSLSSFRFKGHFWLYKHVSKLSSHLEDTEVRFEHVPLGNACHPNHLSMLTSANTCTMWCRKRESL